MQRSTSQQPLLLIVQQRRCTWLWRLLRALGFSSTQSPPQRVPRRRAASASTVAGLLVLSAVPGSTRAGPPTRRGARPQSSGRPDGALAPGCSTQHALACSRHLMTQAVCASRSKWVCATCHTVDHTVHVRWRIFRSHRAQSSARVCCCYAAWLKKKDQWSCKQMDEHLTRHTSFQLHGGMSDVGTADESACGAARERGRQQLRLVSACQPWAILSGGALGTAASIFPRQERSPDESVPGCDHHGGSELSARASGLRSMRQSGSRAGKF